MKRAAFHFEAREDIEIAQEYYAGQRYGLDGIFLDEAESSVARVCENPLLYAADSRGVRKCPLRRFPFAIIYVDFPDHVWILAIAHLKRRPNFWLSRFRRSR